MPSHKKQGWESRLSKFIDEMRDRPFKHGVHDCAFFSGRCAEIMTGRDFTTEFIGDYDSKKEAYKFLKKLGYAGLSAIPERKLGVALSSPKFAKRGDAVLIKHEVDGETEEALGIVDLSGRKVVTVGLDGLLYFRMEYWVKAWEI